MGDDSTTEAVDVDVLEQLVDAIADQAVDEHPGVYAQLDEQLSQRLADLDDLD